MRRLLRFLDTAKSTYNAPFAKLCKEVFQSRAESSNNSKFLKPLRSWFEKLEDESNFNNLPDHFTPIMHLILLVWKGSAYYNTPARLVVLIREICNTLIRQAQKYIDGARVFEMIENEETREAIEMLQNVVKVFGKFKSTFFEYKNKANAECPNNQVRRGLAFTVQGAKSGSKHAIRSPSAISLAGAQPRAPPLFTPTNMRCVCEALFARVP